MAKCGVMTCSDRAMLPAACCALLSFARHSTRDIQYILIGTGLSAKDEDDIEQFCQKHGLEITVIAFDSAASVMQTQGRWSQATLMRLYADSLVPDDFDLLLYVDADVMAVGPTDRLWQIDLAGHLVAAVNDYIMAFPVKAQRCVQRLGLAGDRKYFNAGVILFSWKRCIDEGLFTECRRLIAENPSGFKANDQDVLNIVCEGRWLPLDHAWNVQTGIACVVDDPVIVHFTGRRKPWQESICWRHRKYVAGYRKALEGTPWRGFCKRRTPYRDMIDYFLHVGSWLGSLPRIPAIRSYFGPGNGRARTI